MSASIQYLGLVGRANLGDDVIREAFVERAPDLTMLDAPIGRKELLTQGPRHWVIGRHLPALLGGGTVIGRDIWRTHLSRTERLFKPSRWDMLGAGVEDPDFNGSDRYTSWEELERWALPLSRFPKVLVRGPRSQEILTEAGVDSDVVGDPALLLKPSPTGLSAPAGILLNVTCGEDQWGGRELDWLPRLVGEIAPFVRDGIAIRFVSMERTDDDWNSRLADLLGIDAKIERPQSHAAFFELAQRAEVVVGTRLHANILAAAAGTPTVSLEYRPKCRDFMRSIGAADWCVRTDRIEAGTVRPLVEAILQDNAQAARRVDRGVTPLRNTLQRELIDLIARLKGA